VVARSRAARHLGRGRAQLAYTTLFRSLQLEDLAACVDGDLLAQVAGRDCGRDVRDVAHLVGEVVGHRVDVVREVLPRAADALDVRLAAQAALRADLSRDTRDLVGEGRELGDHRVYRVLELEDLAIDVDG